MPPLEDNGPHGALLPPFGHQWIPHDHLIQVGTPGVGTPGVVAHVGLGLEVHTDVGDYPPTWNQSLDTDCQDSHLARTIHVFLPTDHVGMAMLDSSALFPSNGEEMRVSFTVYLSAGSGVTLLTAPVSLAENVETEEVD